MAPANPDLALRQAAVAHARRLAQDHDDLVPLARLREGFAFDTARVRFGSFRHELQAPLVYFRALAPGPPSRPTAPTCSRTCAGSRTPRLDASRPWA
jgi:hypothetical protein